MEKLIKRIIEEQIENLGELELIELHNNYCDKYWCEDTIYHIDEINRLSSHLVPLELLRKFENFDLSTEYFYIDGYYNPCSDYLDAIYIGDIAKYVYDNNDDLNCPELEEIISFLDNLENIKDNFKDFVEEFNEQAEKEGQQEFIFDEFFVDSLMAIVQDYTCQEFDDEYELCELLCEEAEV